jgi:DNA-binding transcriptional regulator YiaG
MSFLSVNQFTVRRQLIYVNLFTVGVKLLVEMPEKSERSPLMGLRLKRSLTQKQLADALGVTETTVRNWESGRSVPKLTPVQFKKLLKILQITVDELPDQFGYPSDADG